MITARKAREKVVMHMMTEITERDINRLIQAVHVLASDVKAAEKLSERGDTQFARRAYVRAAFALVEGNINLMAEVILDASKREEVILTARELEILSQERYTSNQDGLLVVHVKFVPIRDRIAPVLEMFSRLFGKYFRLDKSTVGWCDFITAIELRNRITHPKNVESFLIIDSELNAVERAREWFADSVEALSKQCI